MKIIEVIRNMSRKRLIRSNALHGVLVILILFNSFSTAFAKDWVYKVRAGDNLWDITIDHLIDSSYVNRVQKLNKIVDPENLKPGSEIRIPEKWIRHFPALLRVQNLQGAATVLEEGSHSSKQLQAGSIVMQGDTVTTGAKSTIVLAFLDGSEILLLENSKLKIDHLTSFEYTGMSDSRFNLKKGRMETQVIPNKSGIRKFQIKTPATVTSVRGTNYRISSELKNNESRTEVVDGKVDVKGSKGRGLPINAGFGTLAAKGQEPLPPVKLLPAPDISQLPETFIQVPIQFTMPNLKDGHGYRVQIAKTESFREILFNQLISSSIIRGPDLPDGEYFVRIRGIDLHQLEGLNAQRNFIVNARPEAPFLVKPKVGQDILISENAKFSWAKLQNIKQYHFQIAKDQHFSDVVIDKKNIDQTEVVVDEKMEVGKYFWRVAAVDQDDDGPFSPEQMFRRSESAPEMDASEITEDSLIIRSHRGLPGQRYHFQIAEDESFSELLVDEYTDEPKLKTPILESGTYYIRIGMIDSDGFVGSFSKPQNIRVPYDFSWMLTLLPLLILIAL
ncbi:MAG: FecR domain-containing protein [Methylococcales bacterium]|nr:FecR domain-containing protein [Methylococcales bacterium]